MCFELLNIFVLSLDNSLKATCQNISKTGEVIIIKTHRMETHRYMYKNFLTSIDTHQADKFILNDMVTILPVYTRIPHAFK